MTAMIDHQDAGRRAAALAEKIKAVILEDGTGAAIVIPALLDVLTVGMAKSRKTDRSTVPGYLEAMTGVFSGALTMAVAKVERGRPAQ